MIILVNNYHVLIFFSLNDREAELMYAMSKVKDQACELELWEIVYRKPRFCNSIYLTHCSIVTPYGGRDLGQHWWWHQAITWTNVDLH